jgi:hypothetical protein
VANRLGSPSVVEIAGQWQRHVSARYADTALSGRKGYGRWGTRDGCPVLYLGRPTTLFAVFWVIQTHELWHYGLRTPARPGQRGGRHQDLALTADHTESP